MKATVIDPNEMAEIDALVGTAQKDMAFGGAYDGAARFDKGIASWSPRCSLPMLTCSRSKVWSTPVRAT